jgi:cytochrome c-type biogenesis protein CcmH
MMFWVIVALVCCAALVLTLWPLLRSGDAGADEQAPSLDVYSNQLAELEQDRRDGLIDDEQETSSRLEIQRRILRLSGTHKDTTIMPQTNRRALTIALAVIIPVASLALYSVLGSPDHADQGFGNVAQQPVPDAPTISVSQAPEMTPLDQLTSRLAARMESNPVDPAGWILLGKSYKSLGSPTQAIDAFRQGADHNPLNDELPLLLGEALVVQENNLITADAVAQFEKVARLNPTHPGPRYYLALAHFQNGENQLAYDGWQDLYQSSPSNAPYLAQLRLDLIAVSNRMGITPPTGTVATAQPPQLIEPRTENSTMPQPSRNDVDAAMAMSTEDRSTFIEGMVQRLATRLEEQPNDIDGWLRLGNAYKVLNRVSPSIDAYARAKDLSPQNPAVLVQYADALIWASASKPEYLPEARIIYKESLALTQPGSPEHSAIQQNLDAIR